MNVISSIFILLLCWASLVGYMMNAVFIFHATELSFTLAARILGLVFFPIGIVAGYM